tara:strand:+ start:2925 stop:3842 length:918 start_codon:yes stop_codon:yes gene_type:complete
MNSYKKSNRGIVRLIVLNVVCFLLANIIVSSHRASGSEVEFISNLALSSNIFEVIKKPWTIITSMFLHLDVFHILFNMLYLFLFGQILSSRMGSQSVVTVYTFGGIVGAFLYLSFYNLTPGVGVNHLALGASGGVMAVMAAATTLNPNRYIRIILLGNVKIKWVFLVLFIATSVYNIDINTGGKIDHMGGAIFGFIYITLVRTRNLYLGRWFDKMCLYFSNNVPKSILLNNNNSIKRKTKIRSTGFRGAEDRRDNKSINLAINNFIEQDEIEEELDKLLARVKKIGFDNLSQKDKDRLIELSKKL